MTKPLSLLVRKEESKRLRWVQKAQSKDPMRSILNGVHVDNNNIHATDGYRIHSTHAPSDMTKYNGKVLQGKVPAGETFVDMQEIIGAYPDLSTFSSAVEPEFTVVVNPKYLAEALSVMDGVVRLAFWGAHKPMEIYGNDKNGVPCHVALMPCYSGKEHTKQWMPYTPSSKD